MNINDSKMTQMTHYYHHAPSGNAAAAVLASVEKYLASSLPPMFDFSVYGWLPYEYVLAGLADEFWSLIKSEWIESGEFE